MFSLTHEFYGEKKPIKLRGGEKGRGLREGEWAKRRLQGDMIKVHT